MEHLTHAERLLKLFHEMQRLSKFDQNVANAPNLITACVTSAEFNRVWDAAGQSMREIESAFDTLPGFTDRVKRTAQKPIDRVKNSLSKSALLMNWNSYRASHNWTRIEEDLQALDATLHEKNAFELLQASEVEALIVFAAEFKERLLVSDLDQRLKKSLIQLLCRMQEIFETYDLLGEQELEDVTTRWAGVILKYNESFISCDDERIKADSWGILSKIWKVGKFAGEVIDAVKPYITIIAPSDPT